MTHNGNDIIAPTAQSAMLAITFPSLSPSAKQLFFSPFPFLVVGSSCSCSISSSSNV